MQHDHNSNYKKLGYSIRRLNDDEIEIRHSMGEGYLRGFLRFIFVGIILITAYTDYFKYHRPIFSSLYHTIEEDFTWAFNPDKRIMLLYKTYALREHIPDYFTRHPEQYPPESYEEFRKPYLTNNFWRQKKIYLHFIWIPFVLFLFFFPSPRGLRLNRTHRMIYNPFAVALVPEKGDPLSGIVYNRFGKYMFGQTGIFGMFGGFKYFALNVSLYNGNHQMMNPQHLGVYPTPNANHNLHIVKAMREFFNEENPEFLSYIKPRYRWSSPLFHPLILFCNALTLPSFFSRRKTREKALSRLNNEWIKLSPEQQQARFNRIIKAQQTLNQESAKHSFNNEVNTDWDEVDTSPTEPILKQPNG